jgi:hypothetical protein
VRAESRSRLLLHLSRRSTCVVLDMARPKAEDGFVVLVVSKLLADEVVKDILLATLEDLQPSEAVAIPGLMDALLAEIRQHPELLHLYMLLQQVEPKTCWGSSLGAWIAIECSGRKIRILDTDNDREALEARVRRSNKDMTHIRIQPRRAEKN